MNAWAWLETLANYVSLSIEAIAIVMVAIGSAEALVNVFRMTLTRTTAAEKKKVWLRYAHWLVTALTFQLAGDIVGTTVAPDWNEVGHLAAIAVIRTFLTVFLDRDVDRTQGDQEEPASAQLDTESRHIALESTPPAAS